MALTLAGTFADFKFSGLRARYGDYCRRRWEHRSYWVEPHDLQQRIQKVDAFIKANGIVARADWGARASKIHLGGEPGARGAAN